MANSGAEYQSQCIRLSQFHLVDWRSGDRPVLLSTPERYPQHGDRAHLSNAIAFKKGQSRRLTTARTGSHLSARSPENPRSPLANELPHSQAFRLAIAQHIQKRTSAPCGC
ncbi:MAG: hypothetical protein AAFY57_19915 [Cyanobacteria bacterium J06642_2]